MVVAEILFKFGRHVRKLRKEKGMSQEELGFRAEIHRTYIGSVERGEQNISLINVEKIANALKLEVRELFNF